MNKTCTKCLQTKSIDKFYEVRRKDKPIVYTARCRQCTIEQTSYKNKTDAAKKRSRQASLNWKSKNLERVKNQELIRTYGITIDQYHEMLAQQNGACAICEKKFANTKRKDLYVDHCHATLRVRGLLCQKCNQGLGLFEDSLDSLKRAISYLERK